MLSLDKRLLTSSESDIKGKSLASCTWYSRKVSCDAGSSKTVFPTPPPPTIHNAPPGSIRANALQLRYTQLQTTDTQSTGTTKLLGCMCWPQCRLILPVESSATTPTWHTGVTEHLNHASNLRVLLYGGDVRTPRIGLRRNQAQQTNGNIDH